MGRARLTLAVCHMQDSVPPTSLYEIISHPPQAYEARLYLPTRSSVDEKTEAQRNEWLT